MCSQPMVHAAQEERMELESACMDSTDNLSASGKELSWKLRVGSVFRRLKVSRLLRVPSSRYFAVAAPRD